MCQVLSDKLRAGMEDKIYTKEIPISDGGEGFLDCLKHQYIEDPNFQLKTIEVMDPLFRPI